ncbi:MAG: hypothetical protein QGF20_14730, partial [Alphaproteobacteria bacterium]|nr:hypothetical protein [Alphaproteobacteria bacterium]
MAQPDLIPDSEGAGRFLPWVVAVMVFFAALAGAAGLALHQATGAWRNDLTNTITVEIPTLRGGKAARASLARVTAVTEALRATAGIADARPLAAAEIAKLLQPWLGGGGLIEELPLPHLIDVRLSGSPPADLSLLAKRLAKIGPDIRI